MQKTTKSYTIMWIPFEKDTDLGRQVQAAGEMEIPCLVSSEYAARLSQGESIEMNENNMLFGLLTEYFTPPMSATHKIKPYLKDVLLHLLERCRERYGYESNEQCIVAMSKYLREKCGDLISKKALKTGLEIVPESQSIKDELSQLEAS